MTLGFIGIIFVGLVLAWGIITFVALILVTFGWLFKLFYKFTMWLSIKWMPEYVNLRRFRSKEQDR